MIEIYLDGKNLYVKLTDCTNVAFANCNKWLRNHGFIYNSNKASWMSLWYKTDSVIDGLSDFDTIENRIDRNLYDRLSESEPEQTREETRRLFDQSLLLYPPMIGKPPHENFQRDGINKGLNWSRYYYGWGMGSGKSYVASAIIAHRLKYNDVSKVLLITTSIGVRNLYHELLKFITNISEDDIVISDKNFRHPFDPDCKAKIVITSYTSFRLICNYYKKKNNIKSDRPRKPFLPLKDWGNGNDIMLVLDESHCISNPTSQQGYYVALHSEMFKYRYLFSGTPADKPEKIYNQFKVLDPWLTYNLSFMEWKNKMAELGDRFSQYSVREWKKDELEKQNQRFLQNHGVYYSTNELIDLPEYYEKKIYVEMSPKHRNLYQSVVSMDIKNIYGRVKDFVSRFPYLQMILDNPSMMNNHRDRFDDNVNRLLDNFKDSYEEKYNALDDIITDHVGEKILVWCIHPSTIHKISERYRNMNPICITGETPQKDRFNLVNQFRLNEDNKMLIANITCLATSVTITECKLQVYFERSYSFTEYSQSRNRIYRLGQESNVESYILIYNRSLDCLLDKNLDSKGTLVDNLCAKDFLTNEQWANIFNCTERTKID